MSSLPSSESSARPRVCCCSLSTAAAFRRRKKPAAFRHDRRAISSRRSTLRSTAPLATSMRQSAIRTMAHCILLRSSPVPRCEATLATTVCSSTRTRKTSSFSCGKRHSSSTAEDLCMRRSKAGSVPDFNFSILFRSAVPPPTIRPNGGHSVRPPDSEVGKAGKGTNGAPLSRLPCYGNIRGNLP